MKQAKIESSQFQADSITYYDEVNNYLYITFANGAIYRYDKVPDSVFDCLKSASSAGKYFNNAVRSVYEYKRVVEVPNKPEKEEIPETVFENTSGVEDFKETDIIGENTSIVEDMIVEGIKEDVLPNLEVEISDNGTVKVVKETKKSKKKAEKD